MLLFISILSLLEISNPLSNNIDDSCDVLQKETYTVHYSFTEPVGNCVNILDSLFIGIVNSGPGGAIFFHNEEYNSSLFIAQCSFTNCISEEGDGGAIQSTSKSNQFIYCCGYQCSAYVCGQFAHISKLTDSISEINVTTFVFSESPLEKVSGESVIENNAEDESFYQLNISNCKFTQSLGTGSLKVSGNSNAILKEISIMNISSEGYILTFNSYNCNTNIGRLNIISNTASSAIIFFNGHKTINEAIFCNNQVENYVKGSGSSKLYLLYCIFDETPFLPSNVITDKCQFDTFTDTYKIGFLNTYLCNAVYTATPYSPPDDEDDDDSGSVWKDKNVIGALSGGIVGALVVGIAIGAVIACIVKKRSSNQISSQPLITTEK